MNNIFTVGRHTCLVCRQFWCTCNVQWSVKRIEECTTEYLQTVLNDCCAEPLIEENDLAMAITMELLHRTRYNIDPLERFNGDVTKLSAVLSRYNHGVPEVEV